jgi:hypothetical protein
MGKPVLVSCDTIAKACLGYLSSKKTVISFYGDLYENNN